MIKNEMSKIQKSIMSTGDRTNASMISKGRGATLSPIEYKVSGVKIGNLSKGSAINSEDAYGISTATSQKTLNPISLKTVRK